MPKVPHANVFLPVYLIHLFFYIATMYVLVMYLMPTHEAPTYLHFCYMFILTTLIAWVTLYVVAIIILLLDT